VKWGNQIHWDGKESIDAWLERELEASEKVENPTCPYCGEIHREWWEFSGLRHYYQVQDYEIQCHSCGETFLVDKQTQVRFESRKP
jgi:transposase-like protein